MTEVTQTPRSYEELLMGRIGRLYEAKEGGNGYLFDEVLDEVEGLFGLIPELHSIYVTKKAEGNADASLALQMLTSQTRAIDDAITRDIVSAQKKATIEWEYRSDMLDLIIIIVNEYQMIPFSSPFTSQMELGELAPEEDELEEELEEEPPAPPVPTPQPVPKQISEPVEAPPIQNPPPQQPQAPPPTPIQQPKPQPQPQPQPQAPQAPQAPQEPQLRKKIKFTRHPKNE